MKAPSLPSLETGPSQDVVQLGPVPDRRLDAILARRISRNRVWTGQRTKKNPEETSNGMWKMTPYGNPLKPWIPTGLEKPPAFPHLPTGPATINNVMERFKEESWTSGGQN